MIFLMMNIASFSNNFISLCYFKNKSIHFKYYNIESQSCSEKKYKIRCAENNRFFNLNNTKVYIDYEENPEYHSDLINEIKSKIVIPKSRPVYMPLYYLFFILNDIGSILFYGVTQDPTGCDFARDEYYHSLFRVMINFNGKFSPAKIKNQNVACIYKVEFNFNKI